MREEHFCLSSCTVHHQEKAKCPGPCSCLLLGTEMRKNMPTPRKLGTLLNCWRWEREVPPEQGSNIPWAREGMCLLVWAGVNFLHSSSSWAEISICAGNMLITQGCFPYCPAKLTQRQGLFCSTHSSTREGAEPGQLIPSDPKDIIPPHMASCSASKAGGRRRKGGHLEWRCLFSQVTATRDGILLSWGWLNTSLPVGSKERIPGFALHACVAFASPI